MQATSNNSNVILRYLVINTSLAKLATCLLCLFSLLNIRTTERWDCLGLYSGSRNYSWDPFCSTHSPACESGSGNRQTRLSFSWFSSVVVIHRQFRPSSIVLDLNSEASVANFVRGVAQIISTSLSVLPQEWRNAFSWVANTSFEIIKFAVFPILSATSWNYAEYVTKQAEICLLHTDAHLLSLGKLRQWLPTSLTNPVIPIQLSATFCIAVCADMKIGDRKQNRVNTNYPKWSH